MSDVILRCPTARGRGWLWTTVAFHSCGPGLACRPRMKRLVTAPDFRHLQCRPSLLVRLVTPQLRPLNGNPLDLWWQLGVKC
jgi:hypothetical protein